MISYSTVDVLDFIRMGWRIWRKECSGPFFFIISFLLPRARREHGVGKRDIYIRRPDHTIPCLSRSNGLGGQVYLGVDSRGLLRGWVKDGNGWLGIGDKDLKHRGPGCM